MSWILGLSVGEGRRGGWEWPQGGSRMRAGGSVQPRGTGMQPRRWLSLGRLRRCPRSGSGGETTVATTSHPEGSARFQTMMDGEEAAYSESPLHPRPCGPLTFATDVETLRLRDVSLILDHTVLTASAALSFTGKRWDRPHSSPPTAKLRVQCV